MPEIILMNDPRVTGVPIRDCREPLVDLRDLSFLRMDTRLADPEGAYALLREGVAWRLARAARLLPEGLCLLITEGYRPLALQQRYFDAYAAELRASHPTGRSRVRAPGRAVPCLLRRQAPMSRVPPSI